MPLIETSSYRPPVWLRNGHAQTVFPALFRRVEPVRYRRERIDTPDGDFLDVDWSAAGRQRVAVLSHGLGGSTGRDYMVGMCRALNRRGWDVLAWNYRGCSGEPNRLWRSYHSGVTEDLEVVVQHALQRYPAVALVGFSLGGNVTLKYLGERGPAVDPRICGAVVFSTPCDLPSGAERMARRENALYMRRFIRNLRTQLLLKRDLFPEQVASLPFERFRTFHDFDGHYTAPVHGFENAMDYWTRCSSRHVLRDVQVPALIVNAADDPFLATPSYPVEAARTSRHVYLEVPEHGGHLGFVALRDDGEYWSERRAAAFLSDAAAPAS